MHTRKFISYEEIARHVRLLLTDMLAARTHASCGDVGTIGICRERLGVVQTLLFSTFNTP